MTTGGHPYSFRIACRFKKRDGYVVPDPLGPLRPATLETVLAALREMFED